MSQRYFIRLAYDGAKYHGWQVQPNAISVQEELQRVFSLILRESIELVGCGRTDAGVHARYFVAHIDAQQTIVDPDRLVFKLNSFLDRAIAIYDIYAVDEDMHARFSAISRSYEYHLVCRKSPFLEAYSFRPSFYPNFDKMNEAASRLLDYEDFTSFSRLHTDTFTNDCDVTLAEWRRHDSEHWVFYISANRFLRNMVRAIVGTLLEVGRGKLSVEEFCAIIEAKDRGKAGASAPAKGLFLTDVLYPER